MKTKTVLYSLSYRNARTYPTALLFIAGNVLLPMLCHLVPNGGLTLLPIYFFTLVGAYKYGMTVGLLTAVLSPLVNSLLTGMPPVAVLPSILIKSVLLACAASLMARYAKSASLGLMLAVVLGYQIVGSVIESIVIGDWVRGFVDFRIGIPGMLLQIIGGYLLVRYINLWNTKEQ